MTLPRDLRPGDHFVGWGKGWVIADRERLPDGNIGSTAFRSKSVATIVNVETGETRRLPLNGESRTNVIPGWADHHGVTVPTLEAAAELNTAHRKQQAAGLVARANEIPWDDLRDDLDDLVHTVHERAHSHANGHGVDPDDFTEADNATHAASDINNEGIEGQVQYLLDQGAGAKLEAVIADAEHARTRW